MRGSSAWSLAKSDYSTSSRSQDFILRLAALFLNFLLRLLFPYKISSMILIASLSFYYLFLGNAPSIQRAYIAITLFRDRSAFSLRISGIECPRRRSDHRAAIRSSRLTQLSFQLTFLCTLAILFFIQ